MDLARIYKDKSYVDQRWQDYLNYEVEIFKTIKIRGDRMH
jgi:tRNA-(ms[2]io[6]A)-hydroxylase